ncbi:ABC transporter ATP-binding protein [Bacteroidia bacterium]|nr:ABC transporter ATP-binding protein [Bacteroidia bacterium]GHU67976.1 ABC transporter ATP-binding protein [Bacteroidia bacterium]
MNIFDTDRWQEIWVTITQNKVRSFLTGFGVFWGIFMLIIMMGAGEGLTHGMTKGVEGFATNACFMGPSPTGEPYRGFQRGRNWSMHNSDLTVLLQKVPEIETLSPVLFGNGSDNNVVKGDYSGTYGVKGYYPNYNNIEAQFIENGRFINDIDIAQKRKVCVIGSQVYEELFPKKDDPIGQYIRVNGVYYQVIGVAKGVGTVSINGQTKESVAVPFTTLQQINNEGDVIHILTATAKNNFPASELENKMKDIIKANNHIAPNDQQAIWSFNVEDQFKMFQSLFIGISIVIFIVGSGTLIAGIVGISNIMVVTIKERTREIGIRRALGAKPLSIVGQILTESLCLTAIAGLLGLAIGVLTLHLADIYWLQKAENVFLSDPMVSLNIAVAATVILLFFGLVAGVIPTIRALQIKAIDAIRDE